MTAAPVVVGRFRLDRLLRPSVDPASWLATDLQTSRTLLACLVTRDVAAAAKNRRAVAHPALGRVLGVVQNDAVMPPKSEDPRGHAFVLLDPPLGDALDEVVVRRGPLSAIASVRLAATIADAVAAIHAAGGVHGGIAPDAIEITQPPAEGARLALRGVRDGILAYTSPGRIADGVLTPRNDAWAIVATLYFAVTGSAPFTADSPQALAKRVLGGRPPPMRVKTKADQDLQAILDKGFARVPSHRHPDVPTLAAELRAWLADHGDDDEDFERDEATTVASLGSMEAIAALRRGAAADTEADRTAPHETPPLDVPDEPDEPEGGATTVFARPMEDDAPSEKTIPAAEAVVDDLARTTERAAGSVDRPTEPDAGPSQAEPVTSVQEVPPSSLEAARPSRPSNANAPPPPPVEAAPPSTPARSTPVASARPTDAPTKKKSRATGVVVGLLAIAIVGGGTYAAWRTGRLDAVARRIGLTAAKTGTAVPATAAPRPTASHEAPRNAAPSASASTAAPSASASAAPVASAPASADPNACVASWFPSDAFAPGADLRFVCDEADAHAGSKKLKRAVVAGGVGRGVTPAMREYSRFHWFEIPVYATLRASCCPTKDVTLPATIKCDPPRDTIAALATAAQTHASLDEPLKAYRRAIECFVGRGEQSLYGESDLLRGGEESAFRAFAARGPGR